MNIKEMKIKEEQDVTIEEMKIKKKKEMLNEMIQEIQKELKEKLSEKRYNHSIGVMKMAIKLAKQYKEDETKAALTALVHDIAKELSKEEAMQYIEKNNIQIDEIERQNLSLLHAKIGAEISKNKYGFTEQMQNAIKYHTTANTNMDKLAKIIYIADKTEENRTFDGVEKLREIAMQSLDEVMLAILNFDIKKNIDKEKLVHPNSINARNKLLMDRLVTI